MDNTRPIPVQHVPKAVGKVGVTETVNGAMEFVKAKMKYVTMVRFFNIQPMKLRSS